MRGAVSIIASALLLHAAEAHDWYEKDCCHDRDCAPLADGSIVETKHGFIVPSGELILYGDFRLKQSRDYRFHWCRLAGEGGRHPQERVTMTLCLYVPSAF